MADFLTEKNGVYCHSCFMTIDLTTIKFKEAPKWLKIIQKFAGESRFFSVTCPHCQKKGTYLYTEVRPISNLKEKIDEINKQNENSSPQFRDWKQSN